MLGSSSSIREANIMQYLGLIEQKTNELLAAQSFLDSKVDGITSSPHVETSLSARHG